MDQTGLPGAQCLCKRSQLMLITKIVFMNIYFYFYIYITEILVMLSVHVGDLITLLIVAKGGQCKDVYVPENVQIGS